MEKISIPPKLSENMRSNGPEAIAWLESLPTVVAEFAERWSLTLGEPFANEASCSWVARCHVAPGQLDDNSMDAQIPAKSPSAGKPAVLKLGWPHMESMDEILGLQFWNGDPTAYLLEADLTHNAMLLEQCVPGTVLRMLPETSQDEILAKLLRRLWRKPPESFAFRALDEMVAFWMRSAETRQDEWLDPDVGRAGLDVYQSLLDSTTDHLLLATDLHAGNVLQAQREPWLVIDPKPFVGDPCYDATQHLLNCWERLQAEPFVTITRFSNLLDVDPKRVQLWLFARIATLEWGAPADTLTLARKLAP